VTNTSLPLTVTRQHKDLQSGDALPALALAPVNRAMLALFAGASGDHNPLHIDIDMARASGYGDVFAQGMLGMAWLGRVLSDCVHPSQIREFSVRFSSIVHIGDAICCTGRVVETLDVDGEPCVRVQLWSADGSGQIKASGEALLAMAIAAGGIDGQQAQR
jgi:acyl dehydratase